MTTDDLKARLAEHRRHAGVCSCGYDYGRSRGARDRWEAHVADALMAVVREAQAEAWDEGYAAAIAYARSDALRAPRNPHGGDQ